MGKNIYIVRKTAPYSLFRSSIRFKSRENIGLRAAPNKETRSTMASTHKVEIPEEFKDQLTYAEPKDTRSDEEILKSISQYQRVISEKNIWAYWHAGLNAMPNWCKRNVVSWARINGPSWTIRVLDTVPDSPNHILKYIPAEMLPEALIKGTMDGPYKGPHTSDLLRGALLYLHGGVGMDVGIILIRELDRMGWDQLEDPSNPKQICVPWYYETLLANHWVAARKGDPFIKRWHELFAYLWKDMTNYEGLGASPLLAFAQNLDFSAMERKGLKWEFKVGPEVVYQYVTQILAWARLSMIEEPGENGFNGAEYQRDHVLYYWVFNVCWPFEKTVGFPGEKSFNALQVRLDSDPDTEEYQKAYKMIWTALTTASMQKITHGKELTKTPALGLLWDLPENEDKDIEPGTFAELLRYGAVHFKQTRTELEWEHVGKPEVIIKKGLYEP